jgi:hypothetical protein
VRDHFPDGQLFADLRGCSVSGPRHPNEVLTEFLVALSVPDEQVPASIDAAAALYRSLLADRRILVVLDNADDADQIRPLLPGSGSSIVVVTSRNYLGGLAAREGAHLLPLGPLDRNDARKLLVHLLAYIATASDDDVAKLADL